MTIIKPLSAIQDDLSVGTAWCFDEPTINGIGELLYSRYSGIFITQLNNSDKQLSLLEGKLTLSWSDNDIFYYGFYESTASRGFPEKYFSFFHKRTSGKPWLKLIFSDGFINDNAEPEPLELTLTITAGDSGSSTSLIPFFAFESKNSNISGNSSNDLSGDNMLGWIYTYIPSKGNDNYPSFTPTANVRDDYYKIKTKVKFASGGNTTNKIPIIISDMNNPEYGYQKYNDSGYSQAYSESCYIPSTITKIYTGCEDTLVQDRNGNNVQTGVVSTIVSDAESEGYIHYHGNRHSDGYNRLSNANDIDVNATSPWPKNTQVYYATQELACAIGFIAPLETEFYVAGSVGVSQLFPPLSSEFITVKYHKNNGTVHSSRQRVRSRFQDGEWPGPDSKEGYNFNHWEVWYGNNQVQKILKNYVVRPEYVSNSEVNVYPNFTEAYRKIWIHTGANGWKQGIPWIYNGTEWKKGKSVWIYNGSSWKEER